MLMRVALGNVPVVDLAGVGAMFEIVVGAYSSVTGEGYARSRATPLVFRQSSFGNLTDSDDRMAAFDGVTEGATSGFQGWLPPPAPTPSCSRTPGDTGLHPEYT